MKRKKLKKQVSGNGNQRSFKGIISNKSYGFTLIRSKALFYSYFLKAARFCVSISFNHSRFIGMSQVDWSFFLTQFLCPANDFIKKGLISYGVKLDRKIRIGEAVELIIYYDEKAPIDDIFSASIEIYYRDSINNVCAQPLFVIERKIYEPRLIDYSEWREQVSVDKNLEHWKRRLTDHKS